MGVIFRVKFSKETGKYIVMGRGGGCLMGIITLVLPYLAAALFVFIVYKVIKKLK